jgi:Ca-activated chloride channel family protein
LKYQKETVANNKTSKTDEIMTVKFRYKAPDGDVSKLIEHPVMDKQISIARHRQFPFCCIRSAVRI